MLAAGCIDMEVQGTKVDAIAITECGTSVITGCVGSYRMVNSLQSTCQSGHGGGIALLLHPEYHPLGSRVSTYYIAAALQHFSTDTKYLVCAVYIPPASLQRRPEGFQGYGFVLEAMQGDLLGLLLEHNIVANIIIIMGNFNAHIGKSPCGIPSNH